MSENQQSTPFGIGNGGTTENPSTWYDKISAYNQLNYKKKRGAKHEVGVTVEAIIPSVEEIRLLGNRHRQCNYYQMGVDVCHTSMLMQGADNFLACKEPIDMMWRCYTEEKYGNSLRDAPEYTKQHEKAFYECMFREATGLDVCMRHFTNVIREIHRSGESELNTNF
jgi:hypothetical protein